MSRRPCRGARRGPADLLIQAQDAPAETTSFVGRVDDIAEAAARIGAARLVTLTGIGGVGKTRLAGRAAGAVSDQFADGVAWCELAPLTESAAVAPALATSLGVRRTADAGVVDSVVDFLRSQAAAAGADNCEHVLQAVRPLVEAILRGCPGVVVLATSRERLGVNGERVQPVDPLPFPTPNIRSMSRRRRLPCSSTGHTPYALTSSSAQPTWPPSSACVGTSMGCHSPSSSLLPGCDP